MSETMIPVEQAFADWRKDPAYSEAFAELEGEFALADAMIRARAAAQVSQEEIARRMESSQPAAARLEAGRGNPSLKTLRRYAAATGTRLSIAFEPLAQPVMPLTDPHRAPSGR